MLEPTHWDDEIARRKYGALRAEFHNLSAFRYNNLYLGLVGALYVTGEQIPGEKNQMPCNGPIDSQIVYSRDGINWADAGNSSRRRGLIRQRHDRRNRQGADNKGRRGSLALHRL